VLDADLILAAEGQDQTVIALTGCHRPPFGRLGTGIYLTSWPTQARANTKYGLWEMWSDELDRLGVSNPH
jgi:hypothetical protein